MYSQMLVSVNVILKIIREKDLSFTEIIRIDFC